VVDLRLRGILVLLAAALGAGACQQPAQGKTDGSAVAATEVQVAPAREVRLDRTIDVSGALAAEQQSVLSMKIPGRLAVLNVDLGSAVSAGQPLASIEPTDFNLRVAQADAALKQASARLGLADGDEDAIEPEKTAIVRQAKAVLDEAELTLKRVRTFVDRGLSSRAELDSAEAAYKVADGRYQDAIEEVRNRQALVAQRRSELELAREQLAATVLRAPFDGRILDRTAALGQYVPAGTPVMTIVRVDPLRLRVDVPEREAGSVRLNQEVRVTVEGDPAVYTGRIARLSPAISTDNRTLLVEAEIRNNPARLRPGAFVRAAIVVESGRTAVLVPTSSIVSFAGVDKVFVVEQGRATERRVQLGRTDADAVEIAKGMQAGEQVIVKPGNLVTGAPVRVSTVTNTR
jgi:multidrug efflux pump subunit AcrA (membrane-fusion protein)